MSPSSMISDSYYASENTHHVLVKSESSPSPSLLPASASLQPQHPLSVFSHSYQPFHHQSVFRFGVGANPGSFSPPMAYNRQWQTSDSDQNTSVSASGKYDINLDNAMSFNDECDDVAELMEIGHGNNGSTRILESNSITGERTVRRRSSKACDQCRKSKCKCERPTPNEPCKNCVILGTSCTFLGPSRKRGPPKGYIDAIEARLHQTEALLGIMLASGDERANTLLRDIAQDPLAREIINRVDNSPYGVKGRNEGNEGDRTNGKSRHAVAAAEGKDGDSFNDLTSTHPSNEWQDRVTAILRSSSSSSRLSTNSPEHSSVPSSHNSILQSRIREGLPALVTSLPGARGGDRSLSPERRQRRRVDESADDLHDGSYGFQSASAPVSTVTTPIVTAFSSRYPSSASSATSSPGRPPMSFLGRKSSNSNSLTSLSPTSHDSQSGGLSAGTTEITPTPGRSLPKELLEDSCLLDDDEQLTGAVGQLSLNEEEQVRYHGKASGLHLLGSKDRLDHRNEGGIWRFPKARVWPPLPSTLRSLSEAEEITSHLPPPEVQEHLLDIYFTHVHPTIPVIHRSIFFYALRSGPPTSYSDSPSIIPQAHTFDSDARSTSSTSNTSSPYNRRPRRVPVLLLFAMFSIAARYSNHPSIPPKPFASSSKDSSTSHMWAAGDEYLEQAQKILDKIYANSRPSTCQALLLMGYREVGIGAMAQAWTYVGMAIRMAQDLGMHRSADRWTRVGLGGRLFGDQELQERRRIWYTCVVMDKYVSAYIGRPLMIFERDFDTTLPSVDDPEETRDIQTRDSDIPVPGRIISCFNATAGLSGILSMIIQAIYAVRPVYSRHGESVYLEGILDKWYHELPEHLRHQPLSSKHPIPLPHVLTLHLQYWCAVLLLHRPFIRNSSRANPKRRSFTNIHENESSTIAGEKSYELCAGAANHITSIASLYMERYSLDYCPVFLCYYIFTAGVMHVTTLSAFPNDPQGRLGLQKCLDILKAMEIVWPGACRAFELLQGAKVDLETGSTDAISPLTRYKRPLERTTDAGGYEVSDLQYPSNSPPLETFRNHNYNGTSYPSTNMHSPPSPYYTPSTTTNFNQQRWPSQNHFNNMPYNGTLSPVLPQSYSTGLVEDRVQAMGHHSHPAISSNHRNSSNESSYPSEFWNDYSAFPHLEHGYHNSIPDQHLAHPHHTSSSHVFASEPYDT